MSGWQRIVTNKGRLARQASCSQLKRRTITPRPSKGTDYESPCEEDPITQQQSVEIGSQGSIIIVTGRVWPPNTCYEITAALTVPDSTHFRVDIDATGLLGPYAVCFDVSISVPYVARFAATRPGRYEVEVFHRVDGRTRIRVSKLLTL